MIQRNANNSPGDSIVNAWIFQLNNYAFVQFRSIEETNNALNKLNGVSLLGNILKVGRPKTYINTENNNNEEHEDEESKRIPDNTFSAVLVSNKYLLLIYIYAFSK